MEIKLYFKIIDNIIETTDYNDYFRLTGYTLYMYSYNEDQDAYVLSYTQELLFNSTFFII